MAKAKSTAPHADLLTKEPNFKQVAFADWIEAQTGYEPDMKSVQLALSLTGPWRRSDALAEVKASHETVRDRNKRLAAERRKEREQDKIRKLKEELAKLEGKEAGAEVAAGRHLRDEPVPDNVRPIKKSAAKKKSASKTADSKPAAVKKSAPAKEAPKAAPKSAAKAPAKTAAPPVAPRPSSSVVDDDDF